ncbi:nucleoporin NUP188-like [Erethizon dorsatum]
MSSGLKLWGSRVTRDASASGPLTPPSGPDRRRHSSALFTAPTAPAADASPPWAAPSWPGSAPPSRDQKPRLQAKSSAALSRGSDVWGRGQGARARVKMAADAGRFCVRSSRELWTILLGRSALRELNQIEAELNKHWQRLLEGLSYYRPPSPSSAEKVKADEELAPQLKEVGLRISKFLGLDAEQSVLLLQCYIQEDYRGTVDSLKTVLQDERQSQALILKVADYYYEERTCVLRCVLHLLTYFQDERHPYRVEYADCVDKLDKEQLVVKYRQQFEELCKAEAPTWETRGNLMKNSEVNTLMTS